MALPGFPGVSSLAICTVVPSDLILPKRFDEDRDNDRDNDGTDEDRDEDRDKDGSGNRCEHRSHKASPFAAPPSYSSF